MSVEPGAQPPAGWIPLCVPEIGGAEWTYIKECLDTGWVSSAGSYVDRFERELAAAAGSRYAVATVSGTAALHVALMVAGVGPDDEVIMSDLTFIAPANAVRYAGAHPVFVDAEPDYWQIDVVKLEDFLTRRCTRAGGILRNTATGRRIAAILPVHILGGVCDLDPILSLGNQFEIPVIEDATEALGATYKGRPAGSFGLLGCFSYNGNKLITTGGGGMVVTDDERLAARARYLTTQAKDDPVEFIHGDVGFNYRLPNLLAAMGCAQLEQLHQYVEKKRAIAAEYARTVGSLPGLHPMREAPGTTSAFWMYTLRIDPALAGRDSRQLMALLDAAHIQSRPVWQPMHLSPAHRASSATDCAVAERLNRECLSLPCSVGLSHEQQHRVIEVLTGAVGSTAASGQRSAQA
jgi:perosamine synthetase